MSLDIISKTLSSAKKIGITYHVSPDGDAVGSALALLEGLRTLNKEAYILSKETISDNLKFLYNSNEINGTTLCPTKDTDVVIVLDCGNTERICCDLSNYNGIVLNVDHHLSNDNYGLYNYVDVTAAATCEIIFKLLSLLGIDFDSNDENLVNIGTCIYTGLITDTGSFRHSNVTYKTLEIASVLKKCGVNNTFICQSLFDNKNFNRLQFLGYMLTKMKLDLNDKVAVFEIPSSLKEEFGLDSSDTSDIISYGLQIKGVEVTLLIKETDTGVKCSLRSKNKVDVRKITEIFGGGGHIKAAGAAIDNVTLSVAKELLLKEIEKEL